MYKLNSLREHLLRHVPGLKINPERLQVFIAKEGSITCAAEPSGGISGLQYHYEAQALITDYDGHPDAFIVPALEWVAQHQPELLLSHEASRQGIRFESDIISLQTIDLQITLSLTERVTVQIQDGRRIIAHHTEPILNPPATQPQEWQIWAQGEQIASWQVTPNQPAQQP